MYYLLNNTCLNLNQLCTKYLRVKDTALPRTIVFHIVFFSFIWLVTVFSNQSLLKVV